MKHLFIALIFMTSLAHSQPVDIEKTFDVSKEAMKGFIQTINLDTVKANTNNVVGLVKFAYQHKLTD